MENRFVTANSLIGLDEQQAYLSTDEMDNLLKQLQKVRHDLFKAKTPKHKFELRQQDKEIREKLEQELISVGFGKENARLLSTWDPYDKNRSAEFFDAEWMFGIKDGFDVVIGNPPYKLCQPSNTNEDFLNYIKNSFEVASYKIDLFHLFFEKGINELKQNGILSYITPNTYLTNKYIKPLRKFILDKCEIHKIINHDKVFDSASVDTATIVLSKKLSNNNSIDVLSSSDFIFTHMCKKNQSDWKNDKELIFNINTQEACKEIKSIALGEICNTYFGIQAFDRKSSISEKKINKNYLPFIDGADIQPYEFAIPKIFFNYISENIKSGGDWSVYSKDRIVIRQIGKIPVVGLCKKDILGSNTLYSVYPKISSYDLKYLLACLNSDFIKNYWKSKYSDNKATFPKIKGFQLKELPIPPATPAQQKPIIDLVDKILAAKKADSSADTTEWEKQIDQKVYELYGLTPEEIAIVEGR